MAGPLEPLDARILIGIGFFRQPQIDEEPVVAVHLGRPQLLPVHGDQGDPLLPRRLGHQLLQPRAQVEDGRRCDERDFVSTATAECAEHRSQHRTGVGLDRHAGGAGLDHLVGAVEQARNVETHQRRRHEPEVGERGVAAADARHAEEHSSEPLLLRRLLQRRAGIGDRDETRTGRVRAYPLLDTLVEIVLEDVGLERRARLARHDEQRLPQVHLALERLHLRRVGRVEHVQLREAVDHPEGHLQDLRTEARAAHAEQQRVPEALRAHHGGDPLKALEARGELVFGDAEPAQPLGLVGPGPERCISGPQPPRLSADPPLIQRRFDRLRLFRRQLVALAAHQPSHGSPTATLHGSQQLVEGFRELADPIFQQAVRGLLQRDVEFVQRGERRPRALDILLQRVSNTTVLAKGIVGGRGDGRDGLRSDQLLQIEHVPVRGVLRARARPEQALRARALLLQRLPPCSGEHLQISMIGEFRVGDGDLPLDRLQSGTLRGAGLSFQPLGDDRVDRRVDAAHEEAGHAGDPRQVAALTG